MSDPWSEDAKADHAAVGPSRLPLAHSAPEYGEAESVPAEGLAGQARPKQNPWQFSLGRLQLLIVIFCVCSACLGALLHVNEEEFTIAALLLLILPSGVLIVLGIGRGGYELYKTWRADRALWYQEPWQSNQEQLSKDEHVTK